MKKIIQIVLMCLIIAGVIIVATIGFNVGTKYSETTQISIKIGKEFDLKDIKAITNEVFEKQNTQIQYVELYKDMVQITVKEASDKTIKRKAKRHSKTIHCTSCNSKCYYNSICNDSI